MVAEPERRATGRTVFSDGHADIEFDVLVPVLRIHGLHLSPIGLFRRRPPGATARIAHERLGPVAAVILPRSPHEGVTGEARLQHS